MYRRPKWLDQRISDEVLEKLIDIANEESDNFLAFGQVYDHFEAAVFKAATLMLPKAEVDAEGLNGKGPTYL